MPSNNMNARMLFDQGRQGFAARDYETACGLFRRAVTEDPMFSEAHRYLAETYEKLGYRHRARKAWEALLRVTRDAEQQEDIKRRLEALA
jgi:Tfp pilus assembly protein PilF